jgi:predicted enzyme related to lactoylglutathione lyase
VSERAGGRIVAVGHVGLNARDIESLAAFYREIVGLHEGLQIAGVISIFEVGTTDLFIQPGQPAPLEFDLAADDVDSLHARLVAAGVPCVAPRDERRSGHRAFGFTDPEGNEVHVVNAHLRMRA